MYAIFFIFAGRKRKMNGHILRQVAGMTAITWQSRGEDRGNGSGSKTKGFEWWGA